MTQPRTHANRAARRRAVPGESVHVRPPTGAAPFGAPGYTFLRRLRAETRDLHEATERRIAPADRLRTPAGYTRLLSSLYPVQVAIETRLASFSEWSTLDPPIDLHRRRRAGILAADLGVLGVDASRDLPGCEAPPVLPTFAHALGALYVLEGSRLGGRILARQVSSSIGSGAGEATRFLRGDGVAVGLLWTELRTSLGAYADGSGPRARAAIVDGARASFRCFDRQLATWEP